MEMREREKNVNEMMLKWLRETDAKRERYGDANGMRAWLWI